MDLKTIAKAAGVSSATVSNVINGNYHKVSRKTIERVRQIVEETHFQPNVSARTLARKKSGIIGVVIPNLAEEEPFSVSPYNTQMLGFLERGIRRRGYYMMIRCVTQHREVIPVFATWNVEGALLLGAFPEEVDELQKKLQIPAVYMDTYPEGQHIVNVGIDDYKGGYLSASYLLKMGHRKIAFAGPDVDRGVMRERYRGFSDAHRDAGVQLIPGHRFCADTLYEEGIRTGREIAVSEGGFTAVSCMSDILAFGVLSGLHACGLLVPDNLSVIGFDNLPECRYSNPQLTSISQNIEMKADAAVDVLVSILTETEHPDLNRRVDVELIERNSVRSPA